ncbi:unnamed protein product [Periconia digitata]|uniref:Uncharacterized protein n=1 Tax=Periconia digitata TaxID=1303443 RepID=A0A9W4U1H8_9PLEO|nr:unnamed protein product [Periconia digitata]
MFCFPHLLSVSFRRLHRCGLYGYTNQLRILTNLLSHHHQPPQTRHLCAR